MLEDIRLIEDHYCPQYSVNGKIVDAWNRIKTALEEAQKQSTSSTNKQRDSIKPCTCNPKPNAWSGSYHKCVACGGFDEFEERV